MTPAQFKALPEHDRNLYFGGTWIICKDKTPHYFSGEEAFPFQVILEKLPPIYFEYKGFMVWPWYIHKKSPKKGYSPENLKFYALQGDISHYSFESVLSEFALSFDKPAPMQICPTNRRIIFNLNWKCFRLGLDIISEEFLRKIPGVSPWVDRMQREFR